MPLDNGMEGVFDDMVAGSTRTLKGRRARALELQIFEAKRTPLDIGHLPEESPKNVASSLSPLRVGDSRAEAKLKSSRTISVQVRQATSHASQEAALLTKKAKLGAAQRGFSPVKNPDL